MAIAAVEVANHAAAASTMMDSHAARLFGGGRGGEYDAEAVNAAIYDFAASTDADDEGVAMGVDDVKDGVASWGDDAVGNVNVGVGNVGVGGCWEGIFK